MTSFSVVWRKMAWINKQKLIETLFTTLDVEDVEN